MLSETIAVFFQTELRWPPPDLIDFRIDRTIVRALYNKLFEPEFSDHAYDDLELGSISPTLSRRSGVARATIEFDISSITIDESKSESHVEQFGNHVTQVLRALKDVTADLHVDVPKFFSQRCKIHCLSQPHNSPDALRLLAGGVANVFERIQPFERPPCHFGVRFRFPPAAIVIKNGEGETTQTHGNYATVRFETYEDDPTRVWMEVASEYLLYPNEIGLDDSDKVTEHIRHSYDFLTDQCVQFLNQFDEALSDGNTTEGEVDQ